MSCIDGQPLWRPYPAIWNYLQLGQVKVVGSTDKHLRWPDIAFLIRWPQHWTDE